MNTHEHEHHDAAEATAVLNRSRGACRSAVDTDVVELADGDTFDLRIASGRRSSSATTRCACSPTTARSPARHCACREGSEVTVDVSNDADIEATVHWHGLRLDNRYDGTHETQAPIPVGGSLHLPDLVPRPGRVLVPPAHPRGLRPGDGAVRQHRRRADRSRLLAAGATARSLLTLDDVLHRGREDRAVQPDRDDLRGDGPIRQRAARRRRTRPLAERAARRGRPLLLHQHRQHPRVQRGACRARA